MSVLQAVVSAVVALLVAAMLTSSIRRVALRVGAVDRPGGRKAHARPTPHLGGVAVLLATTGVMCAGPAVGLTEPGSAVMRLLAVSSAVAVLGLVDDLRPLGARLRLAFETCAAGVVVSFAGLSLMAGVLAVIWIVFLTNAFNLLDNSDGAMGTTAVITAVGLLVCACVDGQFGIVLLLVVLMASLAGFLIHNWAPARIFLGDCGSLFTGFLLASTAILVHAAAPEGRANWVSLPALTVVALTDTALVMVSRRRAARPMLLGGTDHIAHRLRRINFTAQGAAVVLGLGASVGALVGTLVYAGLLPQLTVLAPIAGALAAIGGLLRIPVYAARNSGTGVSSTHTGARTGTVPAIPHHRDGRDRARAAMSPPAARRAPADLAGERK
ncbi:MraY family glycosyltransferase [Streptomyces sp. NPDC005181]|uniref:MraY family glycosyltransferase n=1 Tax=Streptomyces sp. NPDC005181 TaxID=3156869 RepID=UPI0033B5F432